MGRREAPPSCPPGAAARPRRPRLWLGVAALLCLVAVAGARSTLGFAPEATPATDHGPLRARPASAIIDGLGVMTHLNYPDTAYADVAAVGRALRYLGVRTIRDMADARTMRGPLDALADQRAGLRFDFVTPGGIQDIGALHGALAAFAARHPGAIRYVEGPNEINLWPVVIAGSSGLPAGVQTQAALFAQVRADPALAGVCILNLSLAGYTAATYAPLGDMSSSADRGNAHIYFPHGAQPQTNFAQALAWAQAVTPRRPMAVTETGYGSQSDGHVGVDEPTQAKLILNLVFDAADAGVAPVILYELADDTASGGGGWNHYGLFRSDWSPKPAAVALHNLLQVLHGSAAWRGRAPAIRVQGLENGSAMLLETPASSRQLVLWAEPRIWNAAADAPEATPAPAQNAVLLLDRAVGGFAVYDPLAGAAPTAVLPGGVRATVQVRDHPLVVELIP